MSATLDGMLADPKDQTIADLQRQLAEYKAERDEALARETATAEVLQVINSSPGDLAPVFDAMLEKALDLCGCAFGFLQTYEGQKWRTAAMRDLPPRFAEFRNTHTPSFGPETIIGRLLSGDAVAHILDAKDDDAYHSHEPNRRALVDLGGARTAISVALRKDVRLLGAISAYRQEVKPFTEKQIALLQNFAAQAVIAMENARLITETREALEQQTATAEVLQVINSSPGELEPVFQAMLAKATLICDAKFGVLFEYTQGAFRALSSLNVPPTYDEYCRQARVWGADTGLGKIVRTKQPAHILDAREQSAYAAKEPNRIAAVELGGVRTAVIVPMLKEGELIGAFAVFRQEIQPFTDKQIALLQNFAAQAVIAMENARLITETRERTRDLQESLEYQTATSDVLKVISRSDAELEAVLENLV